MEVFEKQFVALVAHVFTLSWAIWALPLSLLLSFVTKRVLGALPLAVLALIIHHVALIAGTAVVNGDTAAISTQIQAAIPKLEPLSLAAEFVAYWFLISVFSLTRQDMFRSAPQD